VGSVACRGFEVCLGACPRIENLLRKSHFGPVFRSFSLNMNNYSPQMVKKQISKWFSLVAVTILGQPPSFVRSSFFTLLSVCKIITMKMVLMEQFGWMRMFGMKMSVTKIKFIGVVLSLLMTAVAFAAESVVSAPHAVVESMTEELIISLDRYREISEENPDAFFDDLEDRLLLVIDFNWIAANVMGPYRKKATSEQREKFSTVFRRGLIETYGRGLLSYTDQKIEVVAATESVEGRRSVKVTQNLYGAEEIYPISYSMGLNKNKEWKVINVVINGINLGKTFRNQFIQSAKKYGGNIDLVIENWATSV